MGHHREMKAGNDHSALWEIQNCYSCDYEYCVLACAAVQFGHNVPSLVLWKWWQYVPLKRLNFSASPHGISFRITVILCIECSFTDDDSCTLYLCEALSIIDFVVWHRTVECLVDTRLGSRLCAVKWSWPNLNIIPASASEVLPPCFLQ